MIKLFFLHFLADFILQPREMGKKKSSDFRWLFGHLAIQFLVFLPFVGWRLSAMNTLLHGIIDRNIWNLYKLRAHFSTLKDIREMEQEVFKGHLITKTKTGKTPKRLKVWRNNWYKHYVRDYEYWEDHWFYVTIGFDQFLHAATLLYLFG